MRRILLSALVLMLVPAAPFAQDIILWRALNQATPTVVPAYSGQDSPFPYVEEKTGAVSETLSAEAQAAEEARNLALKRAEEIIAGKNAFRPELGPLQIDGRVEGSAGPKVLISNQWVGVGRKLSVRLSRTFEATSAIEELRKYDAESATQLENQLNQRLQQKPFLDLTITKIDDKQVELEGDYGKHTIPIARVEM